MKSLLYSPDGTGTNGNVNIDLEVNAFVDRVVENFSEYNDSDLELYLIESVMTRFAYHRIKKRVEVLKSKEVE